MKAFETISTSSHCLLALTEPIIKCSLLTPDLGTVAALWHQLGLSTDSGKAEVGHISTKLRDGVQNDWVCTHPVSILVLKGAH